MATKKPTKSKEENSKEIKINGKIYIPIDFETEYSVTDNKFAIEHVSEHMGTILSLQTDMTEIAKTDLTATPEKMAETLPMDALQSAFNAMSSLSITPELLCLVYKEKGDEYLDRTKRDETIESFKEMRGRVNYDKAKAECVNFTIFISEIISDGMGIYSQATAAIRG